MTQEQINDLLNLLEKIAGHQYTITGAADWPILGAVGAVLLGAISMMWVDLKGTIKDHRGEWRTAMDKHEVEDDKEHQLLWDAMRDCKADCCPPRSRG